jgi:hypothetical protein
MCKNHQLIVYNSLKPPFLLFCLFSIITTTPVGVMYFPGYKLLTMLLSLYFLSATQTLRPHSYNCGATLTWKSQRGFFFLDKNTYVTSINCSSIARDLCVQAKLDYFCPSERSSRLKVEGLHCTVYPNVLLV